MPAKQLVKKKTEPVKLRYFDLANLPRTSTVVVIAKRNSGKTVLIKNILHHQKDTKFALAISATDKYNKSYQSIFKDPSMVFDDYSDELIEMTCLRQEQVMRKNEQLASRGQPIYNPYGVIVLDDILADSKKIFKSKQIRHLFFNGRHINLGVLMAVQYAMDMDRALRSNIDFVFLLKDNNKGNLERYYDNFGGVFENFAQFKATFEYYTENFGMLVFDMNCRSHNVEDVVYAFRANPHLPSFKIGSKNK